MDTEKSIHNAQDNKPISDQVIDFVVDDAAVLTKAAARSGVKRITKAAKRTTVGKAVAAVAKKAKKAVKGTKKSAKRSKSSPRRKNIATKKAAKKRKAKKSKR